MLKSFVFAAALVASSVAMAEETYVDVCNCFVHTTPVTTPVRPVRSVAPRDTISSEQYTSQGIPVDVQRRVDAYHPEIESALDDINNTLRAIKYEIDDYNFNGPNW